MLGVSPVKSIYKIKYESKSGYKTAVDRHKWRKCEREDETRISVEKAGERMTEKIWKKTWENKSVYFVVNESKVIYRAIAKENHV